MKAQRKFMKMNIKTKIKYLLTEKNKSKYKKEEWENAHAYSNVETKKLKRVIKYNKKLSKALNKETKYMGAQGDLSESTCYDLLNEVKKNLKELIEELEKRRINNER